MGERRVLFVVDDEPRVCKAVRRELHRMTRRLPQELELDIHLFADAREALAKIPELAPDLIISDNSMPGMLGLDFLMRVRAEHPRIRTMMLSAGAVNGDVRAAAQRGEIDRLVGKPWDDDELFENVCLLLGIEKT